MSPKSPILPPRSLSDVIRHVAEMEDPQFEKFANLTAGPRSFAVAESDLPHIANDVGLPKTRLSYLLSALSFIYEQIDEQVSEAFTRQDAISSITSEMQAPENGDGTTSKLGERLATLFSHNASYEVFKKAKRLEEGFIPSITSTATFLDIRPSISRDTKTVEGLVAIYQFNVRTDAFDAAWKSLTFQMTHEALLEMKQTLADAEEKFKIMKSDPSFGRQFLDLK